MKTGAITYSSKTLSGHRLDASFHLSDGLGIRKIIKKSPYGYSYIEDVTSSIYCPGIFRRNYTSSGVPFLGGGDIQKADCDSGKYLRKRTTPNHAILEIKKGWTLVTCGGTIGDTVFANNLLSKCWLSQHVMRVIPATIKEGMLFAYLASKQGHLLLTTNTYGSVIPTLNASNIASLPIPNFPESFQEEVDDLIQESARLREEAAKALAEAKSRIEELFPEIQTERFGLVSSSKIFSSLGKRFEASFHQSSGKEYDEYIKEHFQWKTLSEMASVSRPDLFKRNYVKNGLMFLGGRDIFLSTPKSDKFVSKTKTPDIPSLVISEGTILMPRSGTIGEVAIATSQHAQKLASEDVIRISADNILRAGYLYAFLSSSIGKALIQRYIFGSVIQHVEPHQLNHIPVPILDEERMKAISDLAISNKDKLGKAGELENKAISMVEQEIEKWNN